MFSWPLKNDITTLDIMIFFWKFSFRMSNKVLLNFLPEFLIFPANISLVHLMDINDLSSISFSCAKEDVELRRFPRGCQGCDKAGQTATKSSPAKWRQFDKIENSVRRKKKNLYNEAVIRGKRTWSRRFLIKGYLVTCLVFLRGFGQDYSSQVGRTEKECWREKCRSCNELNIISECMQ